jgi:hypothetical protein
MRDPPILLGGNLPRQALLERSALVALRLIDRRMTESRA